MSADSLSASLRDAQPLRTIHIPGDPSIPTRHRWALTGVVAPSGERVKLQVYRVGGRILTTPKHVGTFILALSGDAPASEADDAVARRGRDAGKALAALGY